ncbi:MAG: cytochrome c maturation protein CcmE [Alphaproteobacteria bacterium]
MTRKRRRLYFLALSMATLAAAVALVLNAFEDNLVFFYTPSDLAEKEAPIGRRLRLGGLVAEGSVARAADGATVRFVITDMVNSVPASYRGILPDLFREGQGVVAEGMLRADGSFEATNVLAKHDENYMPKEVADSLKKAGVWKHDGPDEQDPEQKEGRAGQ